MPKRAAAVAAGADGINVFTAAIQALKVDCELAAGLSRPKPLYHVLTAWKPLGEASSL
jgi:hypothetical protein